MVDNISGVLYGPMDAGKENDFLNRFLFQNLEIRSFLIPKEKQLLFDKDYNSFFQNLSEACTAKDFALRTLDRHRQALLDEKDGIIKGHQINVTDPIDDELNLFFKDFFIRGAMATSGLTRLIGKWFDYHIDFLFTDDEKKFQDGLRKFKLKEDDQRFKNFYDFIQYNRDGWYRSFKKLRNDIEHQGFKLPQIRHSTNTEGRVIAITPKFGELTIEQLLTIGSGNLLHMCEEIYVFIASLELSQPLFIWKIPEEKRSEHNWARYKISFPEFPEARVSN